MFKQVNLHTRSRKYNHVRSNQKVLLKLRLFLLIFIGILIGIIAIYLLLGYIFSVKTVNFQPQQIACGSNEELVKASGLNKQNYFFISKDKVQKSLTSKFLCLKSVSVHKQFPKQVNVNLEERHAAYQILTFELQKKDASTSATQLISDAAIDITKTQSKFISDTDGFLFSEDLARYNFLPQVYYSNPNLLIGQSLPESYIPKVLELDKELTKNLEKTGQIIIIDRDVRFNLAQKVLIFSLEKDISRQLASLTLLTTKANIDQQVIQKVDLRFDKAVVVYEKKRN